MTKITTESTSKENQQIFNNKNILIIIVQYFFATLLYFIQPISNGLAYFDAYILLRPITDLSLYLTNSYDFQLLIGFYLGNIFFWFIWPLLFVLLVNITFRAITNKYIHQYFDQRKRP
jgi:hypothetical protein